MWAYCYPVPNTTEETITEYDKALAHVIRHAMIDAGMTAVALAKEANIKPASLGRYLRAQRAMTFNQMMRVAAALGMPAAQLAAAVESRMSK